MNPLDSPYAIRYTTSNHTSVTPCPHKVGGTLSSGKKVINMVGSWACTHCEHFSDGYTIGSMPVPINAVICIKGFDMTSKPGRPRIKSIDELFDPWKEKTS